MLGRETGFALGTHDVADPGIDQLARQERAEEPLPEVPLPYRLIEGLELRREPLHVFLQGPELGEERRQFAPDRLLARRDGRAPAHAGMTRRAQPGLFERRFRQQDLVGEPLREQRSK